LVSSTKRLPDTLRCVTVFDGRSSALRKVDYERNVLGLGIKRGAGSNSSTIGFSKIRPTQRADLAGGPHH
jgi:hypothetical protein